MATFEERIGKLAQQTVEDLMAGSPNGGFRNIKVSVSARRNGTLHANCTATVSVWREDNHGVSTPVDNVW